VAGTFRKILGTISSTFFVGTKQNRIKVVPANSGTAVLFRNKEDTDYVVVRAGSPIGPSDLTTKAWVIANVSGAVITFIAGEDLSPGNLIVINANGDAVKASASVNDDVDGVNQDAVLSGGTATILLVHGPPYFVRFTSAPAAADNGKRVFLSTTSGEASVTSPGAGNFIVSLGRLQGADGVDTTPQVLFKPQSVAFFSS
jgi:hypothetical protein